MSGVRGIGAGDSATCSASRTIVSRTSRKRAGIDTSTLARTASLPSFSLRELSLLNCAMSTPSRLKIRLAPHVRQPADNFYASTARLHTKLTCLTYYNINGRKADTPLHVLEALALFCTRGHTELRTGAPTRPNVHKLDEDTIQTVFQFLDAKNELDGLAGLNFTQVVHRFIEAGRRYRSAPELLMSRSDLTGVKEQGMDAASAAAHPHDEVLQFSLGCRLHFAGCEESLAATAELVLLLGPRETHALRIPEDSQYRQFFSDMYDHMYAIDPSLATPQAAMRAFPMRLRQLSMPELARVYAYEDVECSHELMRKMAYYRGTGPQRDDELAASLDRYIFKLANVDALTQCLGASTTWASKLRQIGNHVASSARHGNFLDLLYELDDQLHKRRAFIDYAISSGMAEPKVTAKLCTIPKGVDAERGVDEDDDVEPKDPKVVRGSGATGSLVVNSDDMQKVLSDSHFLTAAASFEAIDSVAGRAKYADEESRINAQFDIFSGEGLLLVWQRLLRHPKLRTSHSFLNSLTPLATATVLCRRIGFCQVVNAQGARKSFSATYSWSTELHAAFVAGRHGDINWYKEGYCVALMAIRKAEKVDESLGDHDFLTDGDHFQGVKDFMHRTTLGYGYSSKPSEGTSVADFFSLFAEVRGMALEASVEQQGPLLELLTAFFRAANAQAGPYLLQQLDQVSPQGKRLEGWLPPSSESGGVMHRMREALTGQLEVDNWRKKVPHMFAGSPIVVGRFSSALVESPPTIKKPDEDGADPEGEAKSPKRRRIGAQKGKVKFLDEERTHFEVGKSVYGDLMDLATELGIGFDKRCWPVMVSRKPLDARCELCPFPDLHTSRSNGMHKPVTLPRDFGQRYQHAKSDFRLPAKRKALASSATSGPE